MSTVKSTWWSVTAFNNEIDILECNSQWPDWVKSVHGGRERCPETDRVHFQGAIQCHQQQRLSKFKGWLPTAHLEPARSVEALKKYVMKSETAIGPKVIQTNALPHLAAHLILIKIAEQAIRNGFYSGPTRQPDNYHVTAYKSAVRSILLDNAAYAGQLMNPSLRAFYVGTADAWIVLAKQAGADSITAPRGQGEAPPESSIPVNVLEEVCAICQEPCGSTGICARCDDRY